MKLPVEKAVDYVNKCTPGSEKTTVFQVFRRKTPLWSLSTGVCKSVIHNCQVKLKGLPSGTMAM